MKATQLNNPLYGVTLEKMLNELMACYGWDELGRQIEIRCFTHQSGIKSTILELNGICGFRRISIERGQVK